MSGEPVLRARDLGLAFGVLPTGPRNAITDVGGVRVGHRTLHEDRRVDGRARVARTGVTVVLPHPGNVFREKVTAAVHVINGYGKPAGLTQVRELGLIETPIALTTTLGVGAGFDGLVEHALASCPEIGETAGSVNPVVLECNDQRLNDARARFVRPEHVLEAIEDAGDAVVEGAVGAGTGMVCYGWKGGIGTASRRVAAGGDAHLLGVLVLTNFGRPGDLRCGPRPERGVAPAPGSCAIVVATDAPLDALRLRRVAVRTQYGIARTGTYGEHASGEYAVAFAVPRANDANRHPLGDVVLEQLFEATAEATEEAIVNSLVAAHTTVGRDGTVVEGLPLHRVRAPS